MYECKICGKKFEDYRKYGGHLGGFHSKEKISIALKRDRILVKKICIKCGKEFEVERAIEKDGIIKPLKDERKCCSQFCAKSHIISDETKKRISLKCSGENASGYIDGRSKSERFCSCCGKKIRYNNKHGKCIQCLLKDEEYRKQISLNISTAISGKTGGQREGSGRGKHGWYKGYWCDSSWELAFVMYCLDHGIKITRNYKGFEYQFEGQTFKYYPDFIMEDGSYTEIKGYLDSKNLEKINQFKSGTLKIIGRNEIKPYLEYAKKEYGFNYISLYEGYKAKYKHVCKHCGKEYENDKEVSTFCSRSCVGKNNKSPD